MRINGDQKETAIETIRIHGTMKAGAEAAGVSVRTLNEEMRRSAIFKRRILEAREEGKRNVADNAISVIKDYAYGDLIRQCPICQGSGETKKSMDGELGKCKFCEGKGNVEIKTDRNKLTAAIALANAYEPGFRGTTTVQGKIDHDVRVITAVPRPKYDIEISKPEIKALDKPHKAVVKSKRVEIRDEQGNYIGTKVETVEEAIEGEVIDAE